MKRYRSLANIAQEDRKHARRVLKRFRCVDCKIDTHESGDYYSVTDDVWAASGLAPHGGMLCLVCLERRIGRPLTSQDFTCMWPAASAWDRLRGGP